MSDLFLYLYLLLGGVVVAAIARLAWLEDNRPDPLDEYEPGVLADGALRLMTTDDEREMRRELDSARQTMLARNAGRHGGGVA